MRDRLVLVLPVRHPLTKRRRFAMKDIVDLPLVLTDPGTSVRALVDAAFLAVGRRPQVVCETTYIMTSVAMTRAGLGMSILPASAREIETERSMVARPIFDEAFTRTVCLVKRKQRTLPPACEPFLHACIGAMRAARFR